MAINTDTRQGRITLRLRQSAKRKIERAASLEGESVSQFVRTSALERADRTHHEHGLVTLDPQDFDGFYGALDKPVTFNKALREALALHDNLVESR